MTVFKWDGTDLGDLRDENILSQIFANEDEYWTLKIHDNVQVCYVRSIVKNHANLIDELKPVFNLKHSKLGTHRAKYKTRKILLIKPIIEDDSIILEQKIDYEVCIIDQMFIHQIQELYVFREFLGVSQSFDKNIRVRKMKASKFEEVENSENPYKMRVYPISFHETSFHPEKIEKCVPNTVLEKWFKGTSINIVARRLLGIGKPEQIPEVIFKLNSQIQEVVERVDRDLIKHVTEILDRIKSRLLYDVES